ncbi:MAG: lipoyl(octanoyl) transferase LipB [Saccharofermentanales bacterium]
MKLNICKIGLMPYGEALDLQYEIVDARLDGRIGNTLLLLEHPAVLTKGTRTDAANIYISEEQLKKNGISVFEVNRGGDVTYHGPGQIVGYPFVQLKEMEMGIRGFIQTLEASLIDLLHDEFGIEAHPLQDKYTGVWVGDEKITAFGLAVRHGVTMHGFAFNVNTDLSHFNWINPCGLSKGVTSVAEQTGHPADMGNTFDLVARSITEHFKWEAEYIDLDTLREMVKK